MLVVDLHPGTFLDSEQEVVPRSSAPANFALHDGMLYFAASDSSNGRELWKTGGTGPTTSLVRNIRGFAGHSSPSDLTSTDGDLFFIADGGQGREVFHTDGTFAGTQIARDIRPGSASSQLFTRGMAKFGSSVVFAANDNIVGPEVWISDGTFEGTKILQEIQLGRNSSTVPVGLSTIDAEVYFGVSGEVWRTNGADMSPVKLDLDTLATEGSQPTEIVYAGGTAFFAADDGVHGNELWMSDGTPQGTGVFADLAAGESGSYPDYLTVVGSKLFFAADEGGGSELWVTDGATTTLLDIAPLDGSYPNRLVPAGNRLFFSADDETHGRELWVSDGTTAGTLMLGDINDDSSSSNPIPLANVNGTFFFFADNSVIGQALWKTDGTPVGTSMVKDIFPGEDDFFIPEGESTVKVAVVDDKLYFAAEDGIHGSEIWVTDGTANGTKLFKDLLPGEEGSHPGELLAVGDSFFFAADVPSAEPDEFGEFFSTGQELWFSDTTVAGTNVYADINMLNGGSAPQSLLLAGTKMYFSATDGIRGRELWSVATKPETVVVNSIGDAADNDPNDGICFTGNLIQRDAQTEPECTFRAAITNSNATNGSEVRFNIPASVGPLGYFTLQPQTAFDVITKPIVIDGSSQPSPLNSPPLNLPIIEIDGSQTPDRTNGLVIATNESTVRGLVINRFTGVEQGGVGIHIDGGRGNVIVGNYIGTDITGSVIDPDGNPGSGDEYGNTTGIDIDDAPRNRIGSRFPQDRSVISGNRVIGVAISGFPAAGNEVLGNFIGTSADGGSALGNLGIGVFIGGSPGNRIGGGVTGEGNVISGNSDGIRIARVDSENNEVVGNLIGTDLTGAVALGNRMSGVFLIDAPNNVIGGPTPETRNVISGNSLHGVRIEGVQSTNNQVLGNFIGTDFEGNVSNPATLLGNSDAGILIVDAANNIIGPHGEFDAVCEAATPGNTIAGNQNASVRIDGDDATGNVVHCNAIFANEGFGIDLGSDGVTANDREDIDGNPNEFQNFPIVTLIDGNQNETRVSGTLASTPSRNFRVDFYATDITAATKLEHAQQGGRHIGQLSVTTDATGYVSFRVDDLGGTLSHEVITATATDSAGNASEFGPFTPDLEGAGDFEIRTPVILVPGIFGSFPLDDEDIIGDEIYQKYLTKLGI
ncbi:MAG: ELWxxDGT repeat protein, partial [Pirellulaceae bacterium]